MIEKSKQLFESWSGKLPQIVARAPGRVNLIGEHTDYNGGYVLPMAIKECTYLISRVRKGPGVIMRAADLDVSGTLDDEGNPVGKCDGWMAYPRGVIHLLRKEGISIPGMEILITSDLPVGTGVSSSAALTVAFINLFMFLGDYSFTDLHIAQLAQRVENEYAGVQCGIMDPLASQGGKKGHALWIDCGSLKTQHIPMNLPDHTLLLFNTGIRRKLGESAYNQIRHECEEAAKILNVPHLSIMTTEGLEAHRHLLDENLYRRVWHVVDENNRVMDATRALKESNAETLGRLLAESHQSLRDVYRVSCKELDLMVDIAARTPGWLGGRMVGAGFGGCTVHLVEKEREQEFVSAVTDAYQSITGIYPQSFEVVPSDGASCWRLS